MPRLDEQQNTDEGELGSSKTCVTHFDLNAMFSSLFFALFFDWIFWVPLGAMCGLVAGRLLPRKSLLGYAILTLILVIAPVAMFAATFFTTTYATNPYVCDL